MNALCRQATLRVLLVSMAGLPWLASCAHKQTFAPHTIEALAAENEERLGVDDVFEVRVADEPSISGTFRVTGDGNIDFPFAGRLAVMGLRISELQRQITDKLRDGYLKNPQVTIMVKEWNSRKIAVLGQVQKPGSVAFFPGMTLVDAIAAAGGFTNLASKNSVTVRRETRGKVDTRTYGVGDISEGRSPNVIVLPGDVVFVDERLF